jgi:ribosomal protein S18 acetylase RimI-like enzyme
VGATLRPVSPDDNKFLFDLYATTRADEMKTVGLGPEAMATFLRFQFDAQRRHYERRYPEAEHSIIEIEGAPIGRIYLHHAGEEVRLVDISILPEHRGSGIGGSVLTGLLESARASGKPVRLSVQKFNPARRLYERLGFVVTGETGVHVQMEAALRSKI